MIISVLLGGLGNQMFEYAAAYALSQRLGRPLALYRGALTEFGVPRDFELDVFQIDAEILPEQLIPKAKIAPKTLADKLLHKLYRWTHTSEVWIDPQVASKTPPSFRTRKLYLYGYWQSYTYFTGYEAQLRVQFQPKNPLCPTSEHTLQQIAQAQNSVAIHIRRGDYLSPEVQKVHGILPLHYYQRGIDALAQAYGPLQLFIFSDDLVWAKANLQTSHSMYWCEGNTGRNSYQDIMLMSACKHHIIANSSFSWWGAWLGAHPDKMVIAPKQWFADPTLNQHTEQLIPSEWHRY